MVRPVYWDVAALLLPLSLGAAAFVLGRSLPSWNRLVRAVLLGLTVLAIGVVGSALYWAPLSPLSRVLSLVGGSTVFLSWAALLLLGTGWAAPGRSMSSGFLGCLAVVALVLIAVECSGPLLWRSAWAEAWERRANEYGCLHQSSGMTCGPTAAVMLLNQHGIDVGEGEMAYWAGTSPFGTDAWSLARGLDNLARSHGLRAEVQLADYDTLLQRGEPFVAHMKIPGLGSHAWFIERLTPDHVEYIDPLGGRRGQESREDFERWWDGTAIWLIAAGIR